MNYKKKSKCTRTQPVTGFWSKLTSISKSNTRNLHSSTRTHFPLSMIYSTLAAATSPKIAARSESGSRRGSPANDSGT